MKGLAARHVALDVLVKVDTDNAFANLALNAAFKRTQLSERDRAFATLLVQGVLRHRDSLDASIAKFSKHPLSKMPAALRNVLRLAVFQLEHVEDLPPSAILNTATELAKITGHAGSGKLANGLLRNYIRSAEGGNQNGGHATSATAGTAESAATPKSVADLAQQYSIPVWLVQKWIDNRGLEETEALLKYSQSIPELTIRVNETAIDTDSLLNILTNKGIEARKGKWVDSCLIISNRGQYKGPIEKLPGYVDGMYSVQDEAAAFVTKVLDPKPGEVIIDLCAAPGGKSVHMAELMENRGRVIAVDVSGNRLNLLKQTRRRLGLTNIEVMEADGTSFELPEKADRLLIDAPCTGTGVINRRSDLRFKREQPDIEALCKIQRSLLARAKHLLKPGGTLVYSTCSIEPEENEQAIEWFLSEFPDFKQSELAPFMPPDASSSGFSLQMLPHKHGTSGFYVARMTYEPSL
jgi:16S rRNA (cytosine967-C5)-methyltransferase